MTQDPNKKTLRSFQCRDYLWEIFEQMSAELECSVDYLINEAMRQYARSRNYGTRPSQPPQRPGGPPMAPGPSPTGGGIPSLSRSAPPPRPPSAAPPAPPAPPGYGYPQPPGGGSYPMPSQPSSGYHMGGGPPPMAPSYGQPPQMAGPPLAAPLQPQYQPPPQPPQRAPGPPPYPQGPGGAPPPLPGQGGGYGMAPQQQQRPTLFVIFNGQKIPVNKDEFVIGRGSKTADLPIKDGNISRRHAAVVWQDNAFYMKDLGSTNGIEYGGHRVDTKRIDEGDVFQLCDYELRFTYR